MKILRSCVVVLLAAVLAPLLTVTPASAQALLQEPLVRNLVAVGLAHPATGKLLAGSLVDQTTVVGAVTQNVDNPLNTLSLGANTISRLGRGAVIAAFGTTAANGNTKDIKLFLGATAIATFTDSTASGKDWAFLVFLTATGSAAQSGFVIGLIDGVVTAATSVNFTATIAATAAITISTTANNNSAAASAATGKGLVVIPIG